MAKICNDDCFNCIFPDCIRYVSRLKLTEEEKKAKKREENRRYRERKKAERKAEKEKLAKKRKAEKEKLAQKRKAEKEKLAKKRQKKTTKRKKRAPVTYRKCKTVWEKIDERNAKQQQAVRSGRMTPAVMQQLIEADMRKYLAEYTGGQE